MIPSRFRLLLLLLVPVAIARAAVPAAPAVALPAVGTYPLEAYAAVGSDFAQSSRLVALGMNESQFNAFIEGVRAAFQGRPRPLDAAATKLSDELGQRLQVFAEQENRMRQQALTTSAGIEAFIKGAAKDFHLQRSDSGLAYGLASSGSARPGPDDTVVVTYTAIAPDAQTELPQISASQRRVKVSELLPGLAEGVMMLSPQGTAMLVLPPDLSYADGEWPAGIQRGAPLIYTMKLEAIVAAQ